MRDQLFVAYYIDVNALSNNLLGYLCNFIFKNIYLYSYSTYTHTFIWLIKYVVSKYLIYFVAVGEFPQLRYRLVESHFVIDVSFSTY